MEGNILNVILGGITILSAIFGGVKWLASKNLKKVAKESYKGWKKFKEITDPRSDKGKKITPKEMEEWFDVLDDVAIGCIDLADDVVPSLKKEVDKEK
jgi:hypothetical protein